MFIQSLYYKDADIKWELTKTDFERLTLFVGISGVGKSRILEAILKLKNIIRGDTEAMSGVTWDISFLADGVLCRWRGSFKSSGFSILKDPHREQYFSSEYLRSIERLRPQLQTEELIWGEESIFFRDGEHQVLKGQELPKINAYRSFMEVFAQDEHISKIRRQFFQIFHMRYKGDMNFLVENITVDTCCNPRTNIPYGDIVVSDLPVITKLAFLYQKNRPLFEQIKQKFLEIFPYVEDLKFEEDTSRRFFMLFLKEKKTGWIAQSYISAGMFKTLMFLAQLSMLEGNCVVLIDEIENSLGLNCIDILSEELHESVFDDQFLITSHHPYVINTIDMSSWRIVNRTGGVVTVKTAKDINLGRSSHEAFIQLINASEYAEGIT